MLPSRKRLTLPCLPLLDSLSCVSIPSAFLLLLLHPPPSLYPPFFSNLIFLTPKEQVFSSGLFLASPTLSSMHGLHGLSSSI